MIAIDDGDAGRIVAAIFKTAKSIKQNGRSFRTPDVPDDSTHIIEVKVAIAGRRTQPGYIKQKGCRNA